jgi:hypothetical protein
VNRRRFIADLGSRVARLPLVVTRILIGVAQSAAIYFLYEMAGVSFSPKGEVRRAA